MNGDSSPKAARFVVHTLVL